MFQPPVYRTVPQEEQSTMARAGKACQLCGMYVGWQVVSELGYVIRTLSTPPQVFHPNRLEELIMLLGRFLGKDGLRIAVASLGSQMEQDRRKGRHFSDRQAIGFVYGKQVEAAREPPIQTRFPLTYGKDRFPYGIVQLRPLPGRRQLPLTRQDDVAVMVEIHAFRQAEHAPDRLVGDQLAQRRQIEKHHPVQRLGQTAYYLGG